MSEKPDYEKLIKEMARLNEDNRRLSKQIRGYKGLLARQPAKIQLPNQEITSTEPRNTQETALSPHYVGKWQQFCPTCGDKNPEFKDETVCVDCGVHLGAKEIVKDLKACPNCGGKKAKAIERTESK